MKIGFLTFGCRLNRAEALALEERCRAAGHDTFSLPEDADTDAPDAIVVRCCSVTAKAQRDCEKRIARLRERFPSAEIAVTGCHPDAGPVPPYIAPAADEDGAPPVNRRTSRAYLKVQDGCSGRCAFCIVPRFRGRPRSVPAGKIVADARACLEAGFREIVVTGCNLCLYRDGDMRLPGLVSSLAELESPGHRIRLGSIEPGICDAALLDAMESHPNICRFLHLSLQSGSDRVLRLMRRPYTTAHVAEFCAEAKRRLGPRLSICADVIAGFPGESEADFEETKSFLLSPVRDKALRHDISLRRDGVIAPYPNLSAPHSTLSTLNSQLSTINSLHVFPYSEREGTEAASMTPVVPVEIRRRRAKELERISAANRETFARSFTGKEVEICMEKDGTGYSDEYVRCVPDRPAGRRSLVRGTAVDYSPQTGSLSVTIRT